MHYICSWNPTYLKQNLLFFQNNYPWNVSSNSLPVDYKLSLLCCTWKSSRVILCLCSWTGKSQRVFFRQPPILSLHYPFLWWKLCTTSTGCVFNIIHQPLNLLWHQTTPLTQWWQKWLLRGLVKGMYFSTSWKLVSKHVVENFYHQMTVGCW